MRKQDVEKGSGAKRERGKGGGGTEERERLGIERAQKRIKEGGREGGRAGTKTKIRRGSRREEENAGPRIIAWSVEDSSRDI